jgi:preprotein translocase SecF subunit
MDMAEKTDNAGKMDYRKSAIQALAAMRGEYEEKGDWKTAAGCSRAMQMVAGFGMEKPEGEGDDAEKGALPEDIQALLKFDEATFTKAVQPVQDNLAKVLEVVNPLAAELKEAKETLAATQETLTNRLREPLQRAGVASSEETLRELVGRILQFRNTPPRSGIVTNLDDLRAVTGVTPQVIAVLKQETYPASYAIRNTEIVGPKIGAELREQAILATLYALAGMLIYIGFRFEPIFGVAATVAVFHDVLVTLGLVSIFNYEISLNVIAAFLTLVGYSVNDTIVIFDRVRENRKLARRQSLAEILNLSLNQTLRRTILTGGLTFLSVIALFLFGGEVLRGFSFVLVVGLIAGTYSTIGIAAPIVHWWRQYRDRPAGERKKAKSEAGVKARV